MDSKRIAIHVPHSLLSEAVQKKLFEMGYGWRGNNSRDGFNRFSGNKNVVIYLEDDKTLEWDDIELTDKGYTLLTVDEFFKREAEEEKEKRVTVGSWGKAQAAGNGFVIYNRGGLVIMDITWPEYDEIGKLRPKPEGSRGMADPNNWIRRKTPCATCGGIYENTHKEGCKEASHE